MRHFLLIGLQPTAGAHSLGSLEGRIVQGLLLVTDRLIEIIRFGVSGGQRVDADGSLPRRQFARLLGEGDGPP